VTRLIKRYGSRKLYDTEESRYVSLDEIGDWIRAGHEMRVVDTQSGEDVTGQTLTQIILDEGKRGTSPISSAFLHDLIRRGEEVVTTSVQSLQDGVDRLIQASVDRVGPLRRVRDETEDLRKRLEALEAALEQIDAGPAVAAGDNGRAPKRSAKRKGAGR
jgi:polyhydroxyalkanoate synthesis repressor PhaR